MQKPVSSRQNPQVKRLRMLLAHKKAREEEGAFALEGARLCLDALRAGVALETVFVTAQALEKHPPLAALTDAAPRVVLLDGELAAGIGDTQSAQGVFAVCPIPAPAVFSPRADGKYLLLHEIRDPGNLGAILRTAAALGATGVLLAGCAELWSPKVLRASMGGVWRVPVYLCGDMRDEIARLRGAGVAVFAAALREYAAGPGRLTKDGGCAVLVGNEGAGLPEALIEAADEAVMIPMKGETESLGVAMAAGILLWAMCH